MIARKFFLFFLSSSIVTCSISVSLSQGFLALAILALLIAPKEKMNLDGIFQITILFWLGEFIIFMIHAYRLNFETNYLKTAVNAEIKDVFLYFAFLCMMSLKKSEFPQILRSVKAFAIILVITGFISIFSDYRLGWLIASLTREMTSWGFQHNYFKSNGISINLPIGLMNTHLTYGGLLMFAYPWIFFQGFQSFFSKDDTKIKIINTAFLIIASLVFVLNNARSAMGGAIISILIGFIIWFNRGMKFPLSKRKLLSVLSLVLIIIVLLSIPSEPAKRILTPLVGADKHTDSGRTFIWNSTWEVLKNHPYLGIGPGNYSKEIEIARKKLSIQYGQLAYFYETTQRGHAHNDYLHLWTIFGLFVLILYFTLSFILISKILVTSISFPELSLYLGIIGFFAAGLLQCYFQDDEVVIFFWMLVGLFARSNQLNESKIET